MEEVLEERKGQLENALKGSNLPPEQRKLLLAAMEFGYSAAFSSRTYDMNGAFMQAQSCTGKYNAIKALVE